MESRCKVCNDTGRAILPSGDHSEYLDCWAAGCTAASEQSDLERAVSHAFGQDVLHDVKVRRIVEFVRIQARLRSGDNVRS